MRINTEQLRRVIREEVKNYKKLHALTEKKVPGDDYDDVIKASALDLLKQTMMKINSEMSTIQGGSDPSFHDDIQVSKDIALELVVQLMRELDLDMDELAAKDSSFSSLQSTAPLRRARGLRGRR